MIIQPTFQHVQDEQKDFLETLLKAYLFTVGKAACKFPSAVSMNDLAIETFSNDKEAYAKTLATMHMLYDLPRNYKEECVFEAFPTLGEAYEYIVIQALIKEGFIDLEGF